MKSEIRYCKDIGLWAIDRPCTTCKWRTSFCKANCYNGKLYRIYELEGKDKRNELYWQQLTGADLRKALNAKRSGGKRNRFRLMTRGEALTCFEDIDRVAEIAKSNPDILFWLPTRAWRGMRHVIENRLFKIKNLRLLASIDPSNSQAEIDSLVASGWSTMFFGNDDRAPIEDSFKCPKTWNHKVGHCQKCKGGCFSPKQVHIWLKSH